MANVFTGFLETFVAAAGEFSDATVGQLALLDCVYQDVSPEVARAGETINVDFPDVGAFSDQGVSDWTPEDVNPGFVSLQFLQRPGKAILIRDFEQYKTAVQIRERYVAPLYKRAAEYLNAQIAALINPTNFAANAVINGLTAGEVTVGNQLQAWGNLADAKVPLDNMQDLNLVVHNQVHQKMLGDSQWVQANIVSNTLAQEARLNGKLPPAFQFRPVWDQQMPTSSATVLQGVIGTTHGSAVVTGTATRFLVDLTTANQVVFANDATRTPYAISAVNSDNTLTLTSTYSGPTGNTTVKRLTVLAGTVAVANGSPNVTGTTTTFTTALQVGQWLTFAGDLTGPYQIQSITDDTHLVLTVNFAGTTLTGQIATVNSYTNIAMHRYAIGLALRNLPPPPVAGGDYVDFRYVTIKGIPMRLMVSYQHKNSGVLMTLDYGYALSVLRPTFGQLITC